MPQKHRYLLIFLGLLCLWLGALFYTNCRDFSQLVYFPDWLAALARIEGAACQMPIFVQKSAPTFLHVFAFAMLSATALRRPWIGVVFWFSTNVAWELAVGFHSEDILAAALGAALAFGLLARLKFPHRIAMRRGVPEIGRAIFIGGVLAMVASAPGPTPMRRSSHEPVYMSYSDLRSAVTVGPAKSLAKAGKIYLYDTFLFVNEPNVGFHIFDNTDPDKPKPLHFVTIPGSLDIAIASDRMYVDSFIDLLTFKIVDGQLQLIHRQENAFGYNPYQAISAEDNVYFAAEDIDQSRGVIIGYGEKLSPLEKKKAANK